MAHDALINSHPTGMTSGTGDREGVVHSGQVLTFDLAAELHSLREEEMWRRHGRNARTLAKHDELRLTLIAMKASTSLSEHTVAGRLSVQVLEGRLHVRVAQHHVELPAGRLLVLDYAVGYEIEAREQSAFLLTVVYLPNSKP